ncbi:MAG: multicomponent Na+:H+ antiporter subunit [Desulfuromonadales bacterium]|nr:multicomponent Na+:H+ antiporter subunit [Desulfuromonadales bacterium]
MISQISVWILFPLLYGAMGLSFIRLVRGPTLADRIVAFDLIAASVAGIIVVTGINENRPVLVDVTAVWAVIAFLSVIGFAYYIERRGGI